MTTKVNVVPTNPPKQYTWEEMIHRNGVYTHSGKGDESAFLFIVFGVTHRPIKGSTPGAVMQLPKSGGQPFLRTSSLGTNGYIEHDPVEITFSNS